MLLSYCIWQPLLAFSNSTACMSCSIVKFATFKREVQFPNACHHLSVGRYLGIMSLIGRQIAWLLCMTPGTGTFGISRIHFAFFPRSNKIWEQSQAARKSVTLGPFSPHVHALLTDIWYIDSRLWKTVLWYPVYWQATGSQHHISSAWAWLPLPCKGEQQFVLVSHPPSQSEHWNAMRLTHHHNSKPRGLAARSPDRTTGSCLLPLMPNRQTVPAPCLQDCSCK